MSFLEGKKILLVNGDFVYPPNHGDRVDTWNRILTLKKVGAYVDLICTVKSKPKQEYLDYVKKYVNNLVLAKRKNRVIDLLSPKPLQVVSRKSLRRVSLSKKYDFAFIDDVANTMILENETLRARRLVLHMNNDNNVYFTGLANSTVNPIKKLYYYIDACKFKKYDKDIVSRVKNVAFVSYDEMKKFSSICPEHDHFVFLPVAVNLDMKKRQRESRNVVLIGSLFMTNNQEAIKHYIKDIHPRLTHIDGYKLIIAGNSRGRGVEWIKRLVRGYSNISVMDSPKELESIYADASVFVNPMIHGAGVKLKTINAIVNGLPVVSTTIGNEGTGLIPGEHILVSDDNEEYASYISELLLNKLDGNKMVNKAQRYLLEKYNQEESLSDFMEEIW